MGNIKFNSKEIENAKTDILYGFAPVKRYDTPISARKNFQNAMNRKKPMWIPFKNDSKIFFPRVNVDNLCRGMVCESAPLEYPEEMTNVDMFGVHWIYVPTANGPIEDPSYPAMLNDMSECKEKLVWPNPDDWNWESNAEKNKEYLSGDYYNIMWMFSGYFERLISFLGFEEAVTEMIDDDMKPYIHDFFEKLTDVYEKEIDYSAKLYDIDVIFFHDDWGSQRAPFMSPKTYKEMIVPYLKRVIDCTHKHGLKFEFHSCGCNEMNIETMIEMGVDIWQPQSSANNVDLLYERYGNQIILGIQTSIKPDASEDEAREYAKRFVDKYAADYEKKPIYVGDSFFSASHPDVCDYIYEYSRQAFRR